MNILLSGKQNPFIELFFLKTVVLKCLLLTHTCMFAKGVDDLRGGRGPRTITLPTATFFFEDRTQAVGSECVYSYAIEQQSFRL